MAEGARAAMSGSSEAGVLSDDVFQRELDAFVARSAQATTWRVERLLKQSDFETTELVEGEPRGSAPGRYIRKRIDMVVGAGAVYHALWDAQRTGKCPACVPRLIELGVQGLSLIHISPGHAARAQRKGARDDPSPSFVRLSRSFARVPPGCLLASIRRGG